VIEAALSLCYHWTARRLQKTPEDYAACFALIAEAGLISQPLAERLQQMARFRNLLVHMYWRIDYERVYQILQNDLGDLREFGGRRRCRGLDGPNVGSRAAVRRPS
jgi:uncharacterized protein YutE (UPF0331/DUF86 family)